jgi:hypothetical protein
LSVSFTALSSKVSDLTAVKDDWTTNGKDQVINANVLQYFKGKGYGIFSLTPTVCRKILK